LIAAFVEETQAGRFHYTRANAIRWRGMAGPSSGKFITRAGWLAMATDEESRGYLQERLVVLSGLMFWSFVILFSFTLLMYFEYPHIEPPNEDTINVIAVIGLVVLAVIWRVVLVRRTQTMEQLYRIDLVYAISTGLVFGMSAWWAKELRPSAYGCLLYASFMVLLRAIVVPSTGPRTAITGVLTFLPMTIVAIRLREHQELPAWAFVIADLVISTIVVLLATIGSRIIYGLRKQVSVAMQLGQYTLDRKIGEGGMGEVYRARHTLLRRPTAVKLLIPDRIGGGTVERFEREVQHMSQLTHPNTVAVFDYGRNPEGVFYYAMEYLDGIDLEHLVEEYGPQPADRVVAILVQVCGALHEAHTNGIIHRDIKPANIILCERGAVPDVAKVVDYGLVKEITANTGESSRVILGTPAYIAPEAVSDPDSVGPAGDLYALGAVGYFLLTGKRVFEGKTSVDVCVQHVTAVPVPPSKAAPVRIPEALEALILKCLEKSPKARPSAAGLAKLMRAVPAQQDWTEDEALAWWVEFRKREERKASKTTEPTLTITVELGHRV
jgi:eukaryotic-like serine/threonine-protein kinase